MQLNLIYKSSNIKLNFVRNMMYNYRTKINSRNMKDESKLTQYPSIELSVTLQIHRKDLTLIIAFLSSRGTIHRQCNRLQQQAARSRIHRTTVDALVCLRAARCAAASFPTTAHARLGRATLAKARLIAGGIVFLQPCSSYCPLIRWSPRLQ